MKPPEAICSIRLADLKHKAQIRNYYPQRLFAFQGFAAKEVRKIRTVFIEINFQESVMGLLGGMFAKGNF